MTLFTIYTILYLATTTGIFIIATLVYLRQRNQENRAFALFTSALGFWVLFQFLAQLLYEVAPNLADMFFRLALIMPAFFALEFYDFTGYYTAGPKPVHPKLWRYVIPLFFALSAFIPHLLYTDVTLSSGGIAVTASPLYYGLIAYIAILICLGVWKLVGHLRRSSQNRALYYRTRFLLGGIIMATTISFAALVFFPDALWSQLAVPVSMLAMVSLFGYAIVKHRLFDIRLIAIRLLAYLLSLVTAALIYAGLAFGLFAGLLRIDNVPAGQEAIFVVIAMILALTFAPLKRFFDRATRAIFYQDAYQPQQVLDSVGSVIVSRVAVDKLVKESLSIMRNALKSDFIVTVMIDPKSGSVSRVIQLGGKSHQLTDVFSVIVRRAQPMLVTDELQDQDTHLYQTLQRAGVSIVVNLETSKDLIGYVLYGYKVSGRLYSSEDINLIRLTADELAVAVQNALRFEEISHFNETLQAQVREATTELRESNKKLKSLDEAKDEFISMASHQLRTPLTSVKGYMSMVLEGDAGKLNPTQHQLLEQAFASSQRMVYLISDFLNVSRLQTGKFTIERTPVVLSSVVQQEVNQLKSTAESRKLTIECNVPTNFPVLQLDESKLRQAIMNFIDNAIFYSHSGGVIKVDLVKTANDLSLTVQDSGIGVPQSERHHLFTKFYRATNARTARPDGTGIGLFMAKKVVVAHGGSIIFNSVEGKGSTFGFRLPLKQPTLTEDQMKELKQ